MSKENATRAVREGEELDAPALKGFMEAQGLIPSSDLELSIRQFSNGYSNLTYWLGIGDKEFVLRRPPFGAVKRGHDMGREFKVLSKLHRAFPKAPEAFAYTEDPAVIGSSFYIMEKVNGIILNFKEAKKRNIGMDAFQTIADKWLDTFVELHAVDYAAIGLEDLGRPRGYVERQVSNWGKQYLKAATEDVPAATQVMAWMEAHQPREYRHSLIHNDYKYDNIAFRDESWQEVSAVLDWEMCTLGDPLMDLGTSLGYWTMATDPEFVQQGIPSPTLLPGNPSRSEIVEAYARKSGRSIDNLVFYYVFGLFKIAVIAQQIYYRYKHGYTTDPRFAQLNKAAALCCQLGLLAVQKNRIEKLM